MELAFEITSKALAYCSIPAMKGFNAVDAFRLVLLALCCFSATATSCKRSSTTVVAVYRSFSLGVRFSKNCWTVSSSLDFNSLS